MRQLPDQIFIGYTGNVIKGFALAPVLFAALALTGCGKEADQRESRLTDRVVEPKATEFRPMPESTHAQRDAQIFAALNQEGADLSKARHTLFYFYFPAQEQAKAARTELLKTSLAKEKKFKVEVKPSAADSNWLCLVEAEIVIDLRIIDSLRPKLEAIATRGKGEFDGWECAAVP